MSMTSITGELGIGKTAEMSRILYEEGYLKGCLCISNYLHVYSQIVCRDPSMTLELIRQLGEFKRRGYETCDLLPTFKHTGVCLCIDEAHLTFTPELKASSPELQFSLQFISMARKQDCAIYLVSQDPALVAKTMRRYILEWIRLRALLPIFRRVLVKHPSRPTYRREKRLLFPYIWYEVHKLDYENPYFNYQQRVVDAEIGLKEYAPQSTLLSRKIKHIAGDFIHKLYDSHEMVGMDLDTSEITNEEFKLLRDVAYIPPTMRPERFPTFKRLLGMKRNDATLPTRYLHRGGVTLPTGVTHDIASNTIRQPEEFIDDLAFYNKRGGKNKVFTKPQSFPTPHTHAAKHPIQRTGRAGRKAPPDSKRRLEKAPLRGAVPSVGRRMPNGSNGRGNGKDQRKPGRGVVRDVLRAGRKIVPRRAARGDGRTAPQLKARHRQPA